MPRLFALLALGVAGAGEFYRVYRSPNAAFLLDTAQAHWIQANEPTDLSAVLVAARQTIYRRTFLLTTVPSELKLEIRSFRRSRLRLNGVALEPRVAGTSPWASGDIYQVGTVLRQGPNEIEVVVENDRGPPALLVACQLPELNTGTAWDAESRGKKLAVRLLAQGISHPIQDAFPNTYDAVSRVSPYLAGAFLLGVGGALFLSKKRNSQLPVSVTPSRVRWVLICSWGVLCANNLTLLPSNQGFDVWAHLNYIDFILTEGRLPLATDGWQSFQSPLYYLLTALLYRIGVMLGPIQLIYVAKLLPMLSGVVLLEMSYRSAKKVFAERTDLQIVATVVGGTIPMIFYICQEVGNEPLAGAIGAGLLYLCLREVTAPEAESSPWKAAQLGGIFGAALLAKVSAALLLPVLVWVLWYRFRRRRLHDVLAAAGSFAGATLLVSGWYFARNWLRLGRPFVGGWDPMRSIDWWQVPGYRTPHDLLSFGEALVRPVYSALAGLWDSLYATLWLDGFLSSASIVAMAPLWHYDFMIALAPLALPLTLALIAGTVLIAATRNPATRVALAVAAFAGVCFLVGILHLYMTLPIYSTAKATYALSMVPAIGLLVARGLQRLADQRWGRVLLSGYLSAWVLCVYSAFFVS